MTQRNLERVERGWNKAFPIGSEAKRRENMRGTCRDSNAVNYWSRRRAKTECNKRAPSGIAHRHTFKTTQPHRNRLKIFAQWNLGKARHRSNETLPIGSEARAREIMLGMPRGSNAVSHWNHRRARPECNKTLLIGTRHHHVVNTT